MVRSENSAKLKQALQTMCFFHSSADQGTPLLFVPGIDGTGRLLYRQRLLGERFDVRCLSYPQDATHTYQDLVDLAIRELETVGPAIVLAESFGGGVALMLTLQRPDLVERLILSNTFAHFPRRIIISCLAWIGRYLPNRPRPPVMKSVRDWFLFSNDVPSNVRDEWWSRTGDVPQRVFGRRFELIKGLDLRARLGEITTPAFVIAAPDDRIVPPLASKLLARLLPNAQLACPRTGHAALVHPEIDVAVILADPCNWPSIERSEDNLPPLAAQRPQETIVELTTSGVS